VTSKNRSIKTPIRIVKEGENAEVLVLKKVHLWLGIIGALVVTVGTPLVTVTLAFSNAKADVYEKVNTKIDSIQKENIEHFARKEDVKEISGKVDQVLTGVARLEGYLQGQGQKVRAPNGQ
jgi:hypothetical protein